MTDKKSKVSGDHSGQRKMRPYKERHEQIELEEVVPNTADYGRSSKSKK